MKPAPQTLAEALDVIRAMHHDLLAFRNPEFDLITPGREGEFDDRVKAVLAHSAPVINADHHASDYAQHNEPAMPAGSCDCGTTYGHNATSRPNRVRIEGDGTNARTCITNATTGERIPFVKSYRVEQHADKPAKAVIEVLLPQVSLECDADVVAVAPPSIQLTPAEVQSGVDRVRWAEDLIRQLPADHDGRNSWLLNFGTDAPILRPDSDNDTD